jgi:diaminohydroxyphosphoribosylaminopyrimidine deaminase / 5-amino-6-(5-phosphoribosylamino)uracil reductase
VHDDLRFMRRALAHARQGWGRTTPNPLVGACIVTSEGVVVGQGAHERAGEAHAEVHALNEAGELARGATLYCTLEPCSHTGRTGPCAERIVDAGITRVVAAMEDPFPLVQGRGFAMLRAHGIQVDVGLEHDAAARLNQPFLTAVRQQRPFVILKSAVSADGYVAAGPGERTPITSAAALRHAQFTRAWVDAIGVGSETVLVDNPLLTARDVYRERPLARVVFDRRLRMPPDARLLRTLDAGPVIIVTEPARMDTSAARALIDAGATLVAQDTPGIAAALTLMPPRGIQSMLIEGGAVLHAACWDQAVVDYVQLYQAPQRLGTAGVATPRHDSLLADDLIDRRVTQLGPDVLTEGYVHRPC